MRRVIRLMVLAAGLAAVCMGFDRLAATGEFPQLLEVRSFLEMLPVIGPAVFDAPMTYSRWMTFVLVVVGASVLSIHLIELILKGIWRLSGREHGGLETKEHSLGLFRSAMIVKGILIVVQVGLLFAQAYSLRSFLRGIIEDPASFYEILRTDYIFIGLLLLLMIIQLVTPKRGPTS